jgi:hypothetical protein
MFGHAGLLLILAALSTACRHRIIGEGALADGGPGGPPPPIFTLPGAAAGTVGGSAPAASAPDIACDRTTGQPGNGGCSFFAAQMPIHPNTCYAMFVVNPGTQPARLRLTRAGSELPLARVARVPRGQGAALAYGRYDEAAGLAPGDVAVLFLSGQPAGAPPSRSPPVPPPSPPGMVPPPVPIGLRRTPCPYGVEPALAEAAEAGRGTDVVSPSWSTAVGLAFHLTSDRPVVAYDINPYGGANSAVTSASLLLPQEAWGKNHVAATPPYGVQTDRDGSNAPTYLLIVAGQDETEVSVRPTLALAAGPGLEATSPGQILRVSLSAGQFLQVVQEDRPSPTAGGGLSGTVVSSSKPVGLVGGTACFNVDAKTQACDSGHQQIPPFSAWGSEYAAVSHLSRSRARAESVPWQIVGAVDGTVLSYGPRAPAPFARFPAPAPEVLSAGQSVIFWTADPFVVRSQDADHPFFLAAFMTGADFVTADQTDQERGAGDPEWVNVVPTDQYLSSYTFLTDPTYPETSLVVVRRPGAGGQFADVKLSCAAAPLTGWRTLGPYQFTRVRLVTASFQSVTPGCNNGRQQIASEAPFALTVWGWGSSQVAGTTYVSYAYPAGAALAIINTARPPTID